MIKCTFSSWQIEWAHPGNHLHPRSQPDKRTFGVWHQQKPASLWF